MGRKYHHSKKSHGAEKGRSSSKPKYNLTSSGGRKKLPEDFLYTQNHKGTEQFLQFPGRKICRRGSERYLGRGRKHKNQDSSANPTTNTVVRTSKSRRRRANQTKQNVPELEAKHSQTSHTLQENHSISREELRDSNRNSIAQLC